MARESRRTRDIKRFGEATRLADRIHDLPLIAPADAVARERPEHHRDILAKITESHVISADQVTRYHFECPRGENFDWGDDLPCWRAPFDLTFIESRRPPAYLEGKPFPASWPVRWGVIIEASSPSSRALSMLRGCPGCADAKPEFSLSCVLVEETPAGKIRIGDAALNVCGDYDGVLLGVPWFTTRVHVADAITDQVTNRTSCLLAPLLLTLAFTNCQNVTLQTVDPDASFNRERAKHDREPLVTYHTITIEPMKAVLKTEGNIDAVGLAEALRIVRGHFANYHPDRPLLGKYAGRFWRPSHARGSAENGTIISDYKIGDVA